MGVKSENPDIVPFEDNKEEEEDEESEEEDESLEHIFGSQGRGRGRGTWPPHVPLAYGGPRGFPQLQGFPLNFDGGGFFHRPMIPDGFPIRDLFGMAPCGFGPYGLGPASEMMFCGWPSGGFGMMMGGPGRLLFMDVGAPATGRAGRPVGMPPICPQRPQPPSHNLNGGKRGHKALAGDRSDGPGQGKSREMEGSVGDENHSRREAHVKDRYRGGNSFKNVESESEDGAPRRSIHGREEEETAPGG